MTLAIVHRVSIPDPKSHLVHVKTTIASGDASQPFLPAEVVVFLPVWTPGSYLVREYARHVEALSVDPPAQVRKTRKNAWRVVTGGAPRAVVRYRVYANDLSVRTSHVDESHAFLVGAALFLGVSGMEDLPVEVEIDAPATWRVATSLRPSRAATDAVSLHFRAASFDELIDSPLEIGTHREERFEVLDKPHRYAFWPASAVGDADARRLVGDTRLILEQAARLFGGSLPYESYDLLLHLSPRGRGGLEHAGSAALIAPATSFATREAYLDLLSLVAHETFHAWNVKRIRPEGLTPYRYEEEGYTRQLWWFEGATSYYDWRILMLSQLCTIDEYLDHLASEIAYLDATPGRLTQSLEEASFDAWIKLYRPDENSLNSTVSYYRKGEIVCALLDLELRARTGGETTLDHILAALWEDYGALGRAVPEDGLQGIFEKTAGTGLGDRFDAWIRSAGEVDCGPTLARFGLAVDRSVRPDAAPASLGVRMRYEGGRAMVATVTRGAAAARAGIDPGDEIVAVADIRLDGTTVEAALRAHAPGDAVDLTLSRDGRLLGRRAVLDPPRADRVRIVAQRDASPGAREAFAAWLGAPHPAWAKDPGQ